MVRAEVGQMKRTKLRTHRAFLLTLLLLLLVSPASVRSQEGSPEMTLEEAERMLEKA